MSVKRLSYIEAIAQGWPGVQVRTTAPDGQYSSLEAEPGSTLPSQAVLDTWITAHAITDMWAAIQTERDRRKSGGVKVGTNWFHSDDPSRIQQLGLVMFGANMPAGILWKTMQGTFVPMTPTLASQIFQTSAGSDQAIFGRAEQHRAAMTASANPETYDFSTGWPQTFGEWMVAPAPVASFTADVTTGAAPLSVTFTDTSTNSPSSYTWNFGDGSTGTGKIVTHSYATVGTYTVTHTASNSSLAGTGTITMTDFVTVT